MFGIVASKYDTFTRTFSFGMDRRWKSELLSFLPERRSYSTAVDLACGTGDLLEGLSTSTDGGLSVGVDLTYEMAQVCYRRTGRLTVMGDLASLPFRDGSVDVVTVGYGIRNASPPDEALREAYRVLKSEGRMLVLDFYRPSSRWWARSLRTYLYVAGSLFGLLFHGEAAVYGYISESISEHMTMDEFENRLDQIGFRVLKRRAHLFGGIALHAAERR